MLENVVYQSPYKQSIEDKYKVTNMTKKIVDDIGLPGKYNECIYHHLIETNMSIPRIWRINFSYSQCNGKSEELEDVLNLHHILHRLQSNGQRTINKKQEKRAWTTVPKCNKLINTYSEVILSRAELRRNSSKYHSKSGWNSLLILY